MQRHGRRTVRRSAVGLTKQRTLGDRLALVPFARAAMIGAVAAALSASAATTAHADSRGRADTSASVFDHVASRLDGALDHVASFQRELTDGATWVRDSWRWIHGLSEWDLRNRVSTALLRDAASAVDAALAYVDPLGALPRFGLQRYRILTVRPVDDVLTSEFGYRRHPVLNYRKLHTGCDYRGDRGTLVRAAGPGVVVAARRWASYGNIVIVDHGMGVETRYAHLSRTRVREGDFVAAGAHIGNVGATGRVTGPHLHFEVRVHDNPVDPELAFIDGAQPPPPASVREAFSRWLPDHMRRNW